MHLALIIHPNREPEVTNLDGALATYQHLVGGYIEPIRLHRDAIMLVNEDGSRLQLAPNHLATYLAGWIVVGTAIAVSGDSADFGDVPDWLVTSAKRIWAESHPE